MLNHSRSGCFQGKSDLCSICTMLGIAHKLEMAYGVWEDGYGQPPCYPWVRSRLHLPYQLPGLQNVELFAQAFVSVVHVQIQILVIAEAVQCP